MKRLFDCFPAMESDRLILREWKESDANGLTDLIRNQQIYRFLPTFLYERSIKNTAEMIARSRAECFDTKKSVLLGIYIKQETDHIIGVAEIYNYEPEKEKASIGYRIHPYWWKRGIATETAALLKSYLLKNTDVRKITAHVMAENVASARVLEKNGFILCWSGLREDWGKDEPVLVNKYMYKISPEEKRELINLFD